MTQLASVRSRIVVARKAGQPEGIEVAAFQDPEGNTFITNADLAPHSPMNGQEMKEIAAKRALLPEETLQRYVRLGQCPDCQTSHLAHSALADVLENQNSPIHCLACGQPFPPSVDIAELVTAMSADADDYDDEDEEDCGDDECDEEEEDDEDDPENDEDDDAVDGDGDPKKKSNEKASATVVTSQSTPAKGESMQKVAAQTQGDAPANTEQNPAPPPIQDPVIDNPAPQVQATAPEQPINPPEGEKPAETPKTEEPKVEDEPVKEAACEQPPAPEIKEPTAEKSEQKSAETPAPEQAPAQADKPNEQANTEGEVQTAPVTPAPTPPVPAEQPETVAAIDPESVKQGVEPVQQVQPTVENVPVQPQPVIPMEQEVSLASGIDWRSGTLEFVVNSAADRYNVFHNDEPVGRITRNQTAPDLQDIFASDPFVQAFVTAAAYGLSEADAKRFGFSPITVKIQVDQASDQRVREQASVAETTLRQEYDHKVDALRQSLSIVALASIKGVWDKFHNPVRDELVTRLRSHGVHQPEQLVDTAFAHQGEDYLRSVLASAMELAEQPDAIRNEQARMVKEAKFATLASITTASTLVDRLASGGGTILSAAETPKTVASQEISFREKSDRMLRALRR